MPLLVLLLLLLRGWCAVAAEKERPNAGIAKGSGPGEGSVW